MPATIPYKASLPARSSSDGGGYEGALSRDVTNGARPRRPEKRTREKRKLPVPHDERQADRRADGRADHHGAPFQRGPPQHASAHHGASFHDERGPHGAYLVNEYAVNEYAVNEYAVNEYGVPVVAPGAGAGAGPSADPALPIPPISQVPPVSHALASPTGSHSYRESRADGRPDNRATIRCKFFDRGSCYQGANCPYEHLIASDCV